MTTHQGLKRAYDWIFFFVFITHTYIKKRMIGGSGTQAVLVGAGNPLRLPAHSNKKKQYLKFLSDRVLKKHVHF